MENKYPPIIHKNAFRFFRSIKDKISLNTLKEIKLVEDKCGEKIRVNFSYCYF